MQWRQARQESGALGPVLVETGSVTLGCGPCLHGFKGTLLEFSAGKSASLLHGGGTADSCQRCPCHRERHRHLHTLPTLRGVGVGGLYGSGPQAFWHQGLVLWRTTFPQMGQGVGDVW